MNAIPANLLKKSFALAVSLGLLLPGNSARAATVAAAASAGGNVGIPLMDVSVGRGYPLNADISSPQLAPSVSPIEQQAPADVQRPAEYAQAVQLALQARQAPVLEVNRVVQAAGAGAASQAQGAAAAAAFQAVAQALPQGSRVQSELLAFSAALSQSPATARRYALDRAWEDVAAPYRAPELMPKAKVEEGQTPELIDSARLRVPEGRLRWSPDPSALPESTEGVSGDPDLFIGQQQGVRSLIRGLRLPGRDANVFVTGESSVGKVKAAVKNARRIAKDMPRPDDMIRVPSLHEEGEPLLLRLPAGTGKKFTDSAEAVLEALVAVLPRALENLAQDEETDKLISRLMAEARPTLAPIEAELAAVRVKEEFRIRHDFRKLPGGLMSGLMLTDAEGKDVDFEKFSFEGKPYSLQDLMAEMNEKVAPFTKRFAAALLPLKREIKRHQASQEARRLGTVESVIKEAGAAMIRIANRMPAKSPHDDEGHRKLGERYERLEAELEAEAKSRMDAWEAKLPGFDAGGFGLQMIEIPTPVNFGGMEMVVALPQLTLTYKGKNLRAPETIAQLREDGLLAPEDPAEENAAKKEAALEEGLEALVTQAMELAQPLLEEKKQLQEDLVEKTESLQAQHHDDHEALHEGDHAYQVQGWVEDFFTHLIENHEEYLGKGKGDARAKMMQQMAQKLGLPLEGLQSSSDPTEDYKIQLLVDNARLQGAPVIVPKDYSWRAMFGSAETARRLIMGPNGPMGASKKDPAGPDFKAGYMQKADGGFLILEIEKLLRHPDVYHALIDMLESGQAVFTEDGVLSMIYDRTERYPVPVSVKVIFTGPPMYLYLLRHYDPQFAKLFSMVAQFESAMYVGGAQAAETVGSYLTFMRNMVDKFGLRHFSKGAMTSLLEHAARRADSNEKVALVLKPMERLMREADIYAGDAGRTLVAQEDVERAITETMESESLYRDALYNLIADGTFWVNVDGAMKNTITGLAVIGGGEGFGVPSRISVETYASPKGEIVVSTEERAEIVGSSFKQSIGNVKAFFQGVLGRIHALPFQASVKFEQNYGGLDGDSATQTMAYVIGASLADVEIKQNFAITGSADQKGNVQAIGGINHKIEGAWDVFVEMRRRQGRPLSKEEPYNIIFPAANIRELALRPDVVQAVHDGVLNIIPVVHISQGFELLTGVPYATLVKKWEAYRDQVSSSLREQAGKPAS